MLKDWKAFIPRIGESMTALKKHSPGTIDGYRMLHEAGAQTGQLDGMTRELIALAVAMTTRCDSCIANHARKARDLGVTEAQIAEALGVAVAMKCSPPLGDGVNTRISGSNAAHNSLLIFRLDMTPGYGFHGFMSRLC
ncbi:carboxymuconolactone decarboxylase family protein [Paraburkholderia adhaesiva]|uniref:carboxymuconolactone decarboxylase family protein n=1 Tax=Paraburkholderia adhaesiva TaxID=2883244 RepID=UPI003570F45E